MKATPAASDIQKTLEGFLLFTYRQISAAEHASVVPLVDITRALRIPEGLAEKVAAFLETEGLVDYDDQAVDITIPGMLRAEALLRGDTEDDRGSGKGRPAAAKGAVAAKPAKKKTRARR